MHEDVSNHIAYVRWEGVMVSSRRIERLASVEVFILSGALSQTRARTRTHTPFFDPL